MGLTIHYTLTSRLSSRGAIQTAGYRMHELASQFPFQRVGSLLAGRTWDSQVPEDWMLDSAAGFVIDPGPGCESADFGLIRLYQQVGKKRRHKTIWRSFCKTAYAIEPRHGGSLTNFLRCHVGLVDYLKALRDMFPAMEFTVYDESDFFLHGSVRRLADHMVGPLSPSQQEELRLFELMQLG